MTKQPKLLFVNLSIRLLRIIPENCYRKQKPSQAFLLSKNFSLFPQSIYLKLKRSVIKY